MLKILKIIILNRKKSEDNVDVFQFTCKCRRLCTLSWKKSKGNIDDFPISM